jgi:hypothetical protein
MRDTVDRLRIPARRVLFSHTHHAGPAVAGDPDWTSADGVHLHNTGSWSFSRAVCATDEGAQLFWPGTITWFDDGELSRDELLRATPFDELVAAARRVGRGERDPALALPLM